MLPDKNAVQARPPGLTPARLGQPQQAQRAFNAPTTACAAHLQVAVARQVEGGLLRGPAVGQPAVHQGQVDCPGGLHTAGTQLQLWMLSSHDAILVAARGPAGTRWHLSQLGCHVHIYAPGSQHKRGTSEALGKGQPCRQLTASAAV